MNTSLLYRLSSRPLRLGQARSRHVEALVTSLASDYVPSHPPPKILVEYYTGRPQAASIATAGAWRWLRARVRSDYAADPLWKIECKHCTTAWGSTYHLEKDCVYNRCRPRMLAALSCVALVAVLSGAALADEADAMHCSVTVVGGGWGGAYFAYRMCVDSEAVPCEEVCVFEANQRFGGRAYSTPIMEEGVLEPLSVDVCAYRMRLSGAPTSSGADEIVVGVTSSDEALGLPITGYTNPDDSTFQVVDDGLGNNAGYNTPIYKMLEAIEEHGGRVFKGQRAEGVYRAAPGSDHPLVVRFATGEITEVTADMAFLNTPWAAVNQMDSSSALFVDTNATARECVEMITSSSVSAKYYVQYDDAWWYASAQASQLHAMIVSAAACLVEQLAVLKI
eukprot:COSAG02_NODE_6914_length_3291_cov_5.102444_2_plen_393_part_00